MIWQKLSEEYGCTGKDCKAIVTDIFEVITESLANGNDVSISLALVKFEVKERAAERNQSGNEKGD